MPEAKKMKTGQRGDVSELIFLTALVKANREVALPYGNRPGYDLLVRGKSHWKRVQVKTAYPRVTRGGTVYCDFLRGSGKSKRRVYTADDCDYLVAVLQDTGEFWVFGSWEVEGKRCRSVGRDDRSYMNTDLLS